MTSEPLPYDLKPLPVFGNGGASFWWYLLLLIPIFVFLGIRRWQAATGKLVTNTSFSLVDETRKLELLVRQQARALPDLCSDLSMCIRQFIEYHTQIPATDQTVTELETLLLPKLMNLYDRAKPSSINNGADQLIKLLRELEWSTFSAARNWSQTEFLEALVRTRQFASAFEHLVAEHQANQPIIRQDNLAAKHRDR